MSSQSRNTPIIHTNISTYFQALISFNEFNPVPSQSSHTIFKVQFNFKAIFKQRKSNPETPQLIQHHTEEKTVTFNNIEEQLNYQQGLKNFETPTQFHPSNPQLTSKERSTNTKNQSNKFTEVNEPITYIQKRLNNPITPHFKPNSTFQHTSTGGRSRGAYTRYGGGGRGGTGSGPTKSHGNSTIHDKGRRCI